MKNRIKMPITGRLTITGRGYTVEIIHDQYDMSFNVYDIQNTKKDRLAVAKDPEDAANSLRKD